MKYKKIMLILITAIFLVNIVCVCAADANDTVVQADNETMNDAVAFDDAKSQDDIEAVAFDDAIGQDDSEEPIGRDDGGWRQLQTLIDNAQGELKLDQNYKRYSVLSSTIKISKSITIDGDGNTLDGYGSPIFLFTSDGISVTLKNICFANALSSGGSAIDSNHHKSINLTIIDCKFHDNEAMYYGGAIHFKSKNGNLNIINSIFTDNTSKKTGAAIFCQSCNLYIDNTTFSDNTAGKPKTEGGGTGEGGAAIHGDSCRNCIIINSKFHDNENHGDATLMKGGAVRLDFNTNLVVKNTEFINHYVGDCGGAIYTDGNIQVYSSIFQGNNATKGGAIYCRGECSLYDSKFENNYGKGFLLDLGHGGAIYSNTIKTVENCIFYKNYVSGKSTLEVDGGAIYIQKKCNPEFISCTFIENRAKDDGAAIYLNSGNSNLKVSNCNFTGNTAENRGGAVYLDSGNSNLKVSNCIFTGNFASIDGGAIYASGEIAVANSVFENNSVDLWNVNGHVDPNPVDARVDLRVFNGHGGAIHSNGLTTIDTCIFINNNASSWGGAIYANNEIRLLNHNEFIGNNASNAGAIYASTLKQEVSLFTSFTNNHATGGDGGAVYINNHCSPTFTSCSFRNNTCTGNGGAIYIAGYTGTLKISSCIFEDNTAGKGGAIYASFYGSQHTKTDISNSKFKRNSAKSGGAIYAGEIIKVSNSEFIKNKASDSDGGAIYIEKGCKPEFTSCTFDENSAPKKGGGIYLNDGNSILEMSTCTFTDNSAKQGGGIYSQRASQISNSVFLNNRATQGKDSHDGDGGAIYINKKSNVEFVSCRFEQNSAYNIGGGIYLDSTYSHLKASYCTFVDNKADNKKSKYKNGGGHSIFNSGTYDSVSKCWFGSNNPDFKEQLMKGGGKEKYVPSDYLKIAMKINETEVYSGTIYKATVYFEGGLEKSLLHSNGSFYGDGQFSNIKADLNDMTADVCFKTVTNHTIYGKLDHQVVALITTSLLKEPSEVHITSCENVTYGRSVKVTFTTVHGSHKDITYEVKNSVGNIVRHGKIYPYSYLSLELGPGTYTVTIINPETSLYLGSSDNATFTVFKNHLNMNLNIPDETYPNPVECVINGNNLGNCDCNLTIVGSHGTVYSNIITVHSSLQSGQADYCNIGVLEPGIYDATLTYQGSNWYEPFTTSKRFTVNSDGTLFEIHVSPQEIDYGGNATVTHVISSGATGTIRYYLNNGTFLGELQVGENFTLPVLDVGSYVIIANYTGDNIYNPASDIAKLIVKKIQPEFGIKINPVTYGDEAVVTHTLTKNATGTIRYYLNNGTFLGELQVGENFTLPVLNCGTYVIIANYTGDHNYFSAQNSTHLTVNRAKPTFNIETLPVTYGDNGTVIPMLNNGAIGTIKYYLNDGTFLGELPFNENLTLPVLNAGTYLIIAHYSSDGNFLNATANTTLTVDKAKTEITADPVITEYRDNDYLVIFLKDYNGNAIAGVTVTVDLNGAKNYKTNANGQIIISTSNLAAATHHVSFSFSGTSNYLNSSAFTEIFVNTKPSIMVTSPLVTTYQIHKYLMVNLKDNAGRPISNVEVFTVINGVSYKAKTDSKGNGKLIIRLRPMNYVATIVFDNENYTISMKPAKVIVYKANPKIIAKNKKFKANKKVKKYRIALKDNIGKAIKNVKVTLKVKGKTYHARTNSKGIAIFKINKLTKKGTFKATITYKGNYLFEKVIKKVKIKCTK